MVERSLDVSICLYDRDFIVSILDPESGISKEAMFGYSFDEHPEFNEVIGDEIYSWISLWKDAMEGAS